jgi:hypothetical protein
MADIFKEWTKQFLKMFVDDVYIVEFGMNIYATSDWFFRN